MKKVGLLFSVFLFLVGIAYFVVKANKEKDPLAKIEDTLLENIADIKSLTITTAALEVKLVKEEDFWWVSEPHRYLANQRFIERNLQIMSETPPIERFSFTEDHYGVEPGEALFRFQYQDHGEKRLVVGDVEAPGSNIYVLNKDSGFIYVVHNIWSQFLFNGIEKFYTPYLPIPGEAVKKVEYFESGEKVWGLSSKSKTMMTLFYKGENFDSPKEQWIWFFKKIREVTLSNHSFNKKNPMQGTKELRVETEKGNIIFVFSDNSDKIYIPSINVFADLADRSIQSLHKAIERVVNSVE